MIRPDPDQHEPPSLVFPTWAAALTAAVLIVGIGGMTTYLVLKFDALHPKVGDIIEFARLKAGTASWQIKVETAAVAGRNPSAGPCVFDPNEMSVAGGSLLIEAREEASPPRFHLHWAGRHTAKGSGDCGPAADLTLDCYDLQRLANAAGGFGIRPKVN